MKKLFLALTLCLVASPAMAIDCDKPGCLVDHTQRVVAANDFDKAFSRSARYANEFLTYTPGNNALEDSPVVLTPTKQYELLQEVKRDVKAISEETDAEIKLLSTEVSELKKVNARQDEQISKLLKAALKNNVRVQTLEKK